jgi:putative holliday junction resolvase
MRRAGIDPGSVRTGVAVADDEVPVATPLCTLKHRGLEDAVQQLSELVKREAIAQVVIGLPLHLDGREGDSARRARLFAQRLTELASVPVILWDERLSSVSASRALAEARYTGRTPAGGGGRARPPRRGGSARSDRSRGKVDETAATLILQSYLDSTRDRTWQEHPSPQPSNEPPKSGGQPG